MTALVSWALYSVAVAALLGGGAWALEGAARAVGRPGRWGWLGALVASAVIPAGVYFGLPGWLQPPAALPDAALIALPPIVVGAVAQGPAVAWDRVLLGIWLLTSLVLAAYLSASLLQLRAARSRWERRYVDGVPVWMTRNLGPAALRGAILLPEWALTVDRRLRHLMLVHEEEHVRAHDPSLVLASLALVVLMPWNPAVWWQVRRLRLAIEIDCDARVLRREPDARLYGSLLLEVGRRRGGNRLVVAFSEPASFLERRIRALGGLGGRKSVRRAAGLGGCAAALVALALYAGELQPLQAADLSIVMASVLPERTSEGVTRIVNLALPTVEAAPNSAGTPAGGDAVGADRPTAADTVPPRITNAEVLAEALRGMYPPILRDAGIGGTTSVYVYVSEGGRVLRTQLWESSGFEALDQAALRAVALLDFAPASSGGQPVAAWTAVPIVFSAPTIDARQPARAGPPYTRQEAEIVAARERATAVATAQRAAQAAESALPPPPASRPGDISSAPTYTPMTRAPVLSNRAAVSRALAENYPPLLRGAGIGGSPTVWLFIDESGRVQRTMLHVSSGYEALDKAALEVASVMEFTGALNREQPVSVWISLAVVFQAR